MSGSIPQPYPSKKALAKNRVPSVNVTGANERIAVAVVGIGWASGQNHLEGLCEKAKANKVVVAAACDVFEKRRAKAVDIAKLKASDIYLDYRDILERKDIDAVLIATHDPLHAQISLDALDADKHVYCERPLTRHLGEAFAVYDKVKSSGRVFQVGVQSCSAGGWQKSAELIRAGKIGALIWSQGAYCRNGGQGCEGGAKVEKESIASAIDWGKWLGPLKPRPFNAVHFHQWRMYSDYSAGLLGSQAPQRLHALMLASGRPEFPVRVSCISGHRFQSSDRSFRPDPGQVPAHVQVLAEFPSGHALTLTCSWVNSNSRGMALYGHKATISIGSGGGSLEVVPEKEFVSEVNAGTFKSLQMEDIREHEKNWIDCIRSGNQPNADIELGIRAQTVLSLAEMSNRLKITCLFDEHTRKVTDGAGRDISPFTYDNPESL